MRILSIDPGYERLGIAILEKENSKENLIYSECFKTKSSDKHNVRLGLIQNKITEIIKEFKPKQLAIETLFFSNNQKTALLVSESRGVIIATSTNLGLEVFEYSPQAIKIGVTGYGKSDKNAVIKMIDMIIQPKKEIEHDDEYDAIACGITHLANSISTSIK